MNSNELWNRFRKFLCRVDAVGLALYISRMKFDEGFLAKMEPAIAKAYSAMDALEKGAIANPDEQRMVGHYWLRAPVLAPTKDLGLEINTVVAAIKEFAASVHKGSVKPAKARRFTHLLSIGIGGSALGPEFIADALGDSRSDKLTAH